MEEWSHFYIYSVYHFRGYSSAIPKNRMHSKLQILCLLTPYIGLSVLTVVPWSQGHGDRAIGPRCHGANSMVPSSQPKGAIKLGRAVPSSQGYESAVPSSQDP